MRRICRLWAAGAKGIFSFAKENIPFGTPRERLRLAVSGLNNSDVSEVKVPRARRSRVSIARRFASAPTICCRSASLVAVRPNHRLPVHPSMRRAQQCRIRQAVCRRATVTRASRSKARLRLVTNRRDSWRSHVHRTYIAQRVQLFKIETANVRGRGGRPLVLSLGGLRGILSFEKESIPLLRTSVRCGNIPRLRGTICKWFC